MRAQIDRALVEELGGGMRSLDSWYGGPAPHGHFTNFSNLRTNFPNFSGGVDAPGHTFAYETAQGLREVKIREHATVAKKMPLQLKLARVHFNRGQRRGQTLPNRNQSGMIVSPLDEASSPIRHQDLGPISENNTLEEMEGSPVASPSGVGTWPLAPVLQRPWAFQRSVVSLREMDGTGVNPLEQNQSDEDMYEDVVVNTDSTGGSEWQVQRPWQIQKPPSLREMDGTGRLQLPAVSGFSFLDKDSY